MAAIKILTNSVLLTLLALLSSCGGQDKSKQVAVVSPEEAPAEQENISFERITFSVRPGWSSEKYAKDVEITPDSILYYRLRERHSGTIVVNYKAKLDSVGMENVYGFLDSTDFNSLKDYYYNQEDASWFSLQFIFHNGEVKMQGTLPDGYWKKVYKLLMIIDKQNLTKSKNRKFSTTEDVLLPPPPAPVNIKLPNDSL
ncbi:hypothetical protein [Pontibacter anaerobius]|uniref:Lipoprotein n=1 Tax=Pontibacter anaerobius TaxID=2993940 RepID=A0ABT3RIK4_9BACT|nr:hypothetical protein [Pontibacter anaerobius]MCX2741204.1 hypothetical protein [Pontibacter anaerobius]